MNEYYFEPIVTNLDERKLEYRTRTNIDLTPSQYSYEDLPLGVWGRKHIKLRFQADIFDSNDVHRAKYDKTIDILEKCVELVNKEVGILING